MYLRLHHIRIDGKHWLVRNTQTHVNFHCTANEIVCFYDHDLWYIRSSLPHNERQRRTSDLWMKDRRERDCCWYHWSGRGGERNSGERRKQRLTARGTAHGERLFVRGRRWRVKQNDVIFTSRTPAEQMCTHARQEMGRLPWQPASIHHGRRA